MDGPLVHDDGQVDRVRGRRIPLGRQVASDIHAEIQRKGMLSGDPLPSESELADSYGVSQRVVRDALRILSNQGLVRTQQGKRAVVGELRPLAVETYFRLATEADQDALDDLIELRLALETRAAGLAASRITDDVLAELRAMIEGFGNDADPAARIELDLQFHSLIMRASGNRFFVQILEALREAMEAERRHGSQLTQGAELAHVETHVQHEALLTALETRDAALAEQCMRAILERARAYLHERANDRGHG